MSKEGCPTGIKGLLSEIKILGYLGKHENVVSLIGAHTQEIFEGLAKVVALYALNWKYKFIP